MGEMILDGTGSGYTAEVDSENRLSVVAVQETFDSHINKQSGKVWSLPFVGLDPAGADDYVFYIKNTGDNVISITDLRIKATGSTTQLELNSVDGAAVGGNDSPSVSRTLGSANVPSATIQTGTDITGLTSEGTIFFMELDTTGKMFHLSTSSKIRIPKGKAFAILIESATAVITGVVSLIEEE